MEEKNITPSPSDRDYILEVDGLKQYFTISKNFMGKPTPYLRAVDGVSF